MKKEVIDILICPDCKSDKLELKILEMRKGDVIKGKISCSKCKKNYFITNGIPYMIARKIKKYEYWDRRWVNVKFEHIIQRLENAMRNKELLINYFGLIKLVVKNFDTKICTLLEIGCGSGSYSLVLKKKSIIEKLYLLDISPSSLLLAKRLFDFYKIECHLILADARFIPFKDKSFDLSISGGLIEHFKNKEQLTIISNHCRVSNNVICQVPFSTVAYWVFRFFLTIKEKGWRYGYEKPFSLERLKNLFEGQNFIIRDSNFHNLLIAAVFFQKLPSSLLSTFLRNSFFAKFFTHCINIYAREVSIS